MKWFAGVTTVEQLRKRYRDLLRIHHPDNGGRVSDMQEINSEYDTLYSVLRQKESVDGESCTEQDNVADEAFRTILNEIVSLDMEIEIIGSWLWCFKCFAVKDRLKELGFKYAPKKKAWTWHYGSYTRYHKGEIPIDDIRAKYGSQKVTRAYKQQYSLD